jgi:hypothetical protein
MPSSLLDHENMAEKRSAGHDVAVSAELSLVDVYLKNGPRWGPMVRTEVSYLSVALKSFPKLESVPEAFVMEDS